MSLDRYSILIIAAAAACLACTPASDQDRVPESAVGDVGADSLSVGDSTGFRQEPQLTGLQTPLSRISDYDPIIKKYSRRYGFDWRLIAAQIFVESRFRIQARSGAGAIGLMQIMPGTAKHLGVDHNLLLKPEHNIALGCLYDRRLFDLWKNKSGANRLAFTLASYNAGRSRVLQAHSGVSGDAWTIVRPHLPRETRNYVGRIFSKYEEYKQSFLY